MFPEDVLLRGQCSSFWVRTVMSQLQVLFCRFRGSAPFEADPAGASPPEPVRAVPIPMPPPERARGALPRAVGARRPAWPMAPDRDSDR